MRLDLSQLKACDQTWDAMTPLPENRRLCGQCRKSVVDFRGMDEMEIALVHVSSPVPVCGIYSPRQLGQAGARKPAGRALPVALGAWLLGGGAVAAQESPTPAQEQAAYPVSRVTRSAGEQAARERSPSDTLTVQGRVRMTAPDSAPGRLGSGVVVWVKGTTVRTVTDEQGRYHLRWVRSREGGAEDTLVFMGIGLSRKEVPLPPGAHPTLDVTLEAQLLELSAFYVTAERRPSFWGRIRNAVGSLF